jgi:hypothetical protein
MAPVADCSCGIYAFHPWSPAFQPERISGRQVRDGVWTVWGEVEAWGELEIHEDGFRAEYARPVTIYLPSLLPGPVRERIRSVASSHGVPVFRERRLFGPRRSPDHTRGLSAGFVRELLSARTSPGDSERGMRAA